MKTFEINHVVAKAYDRYHQIKVDDKRIAVPTFSLRTTATHSKNQKGETCVSFTTSDETARLNVDINVERTKSFKFRLFCDNFMSPPCYRFDSDGGTHENPPHPSRTLKQRIVSTPHFHCFDELGRNMAYKTPSLQKDEAALLSDPLKAFKVFCDEENISLGSEPAFVQETLPFGTSSFEDPLEGVEFP